MYAVESLNARGGTYEGTASASSTARYVVIAYSLCTPSTTFIYEYRDRHDSGFCDHAERILAHVNIDICVHSIDRRQFPRRLQAQSRFNFLAFKYSASKLERDREVHLTLDSS